MSSRQLRKLQQQRELEQAQLREEEQRQEEDGSDEEDFLSPAVTKPSLFASFAALQDDIDAGGNNSAGEDEHEHDSHVPSENELDHPSTTAKAKKPKKKKKKGKQVEQSSSGSRIALPTSNGDPDEVEAALRELSFENRDSLVTSGQPARKLDAEFQRVCALLSVNSHHLKVANEMRNLFGRTAVDNHDEAGGHIPRGSRRRQRAAQRQVDLETALKGSHLPGKGLPELTLRRNIFIQGRDEWPRGTTAGLKMEVVKDHSASSSIVEFRFIHDEAYESVQQQFNLFVEMGDPQNLIGLLQRNPYHISLLLQVSKIAKDQTDHALSSDLVERALFTFGRATTSLFATMMSQGKARLDFARPENREFWLAGYHYIKSLMMKGTYRTALEWAKLLLSFDPEDDNYCMRLMIHHLALRAFESQYILDLYNEPLTKSWTERIAHVSPSLALAAMQLKEASKCRSLLRQSIQRLPWLFCKLFQELNLDKPPPSIWGIEPRSNAEELFSAIYIRQTKDLWNTPEATSLLMEVTHSIEKSSEYFLKEYPNTLIDLPVARFVYLDNTPSLMAFVPSILLHRLPNSDSDPLPPDEQHNIFSWPSQRIAFVRETNRQATEGAFGNHFDPIAAIRALIPGRGLRGEEQVITDDEIREFVEENINRNEEETDVPDSEEDGEAFLESRPSGIRRLYDFFLGFRTQRQSSGSNGDDDPSTDVDEETDEQ